MQYLCESGIHSDLMLVVLICEYPDSYCLTLWQAERHFCHLRFTGAATILSFFRSMFTSLDSIGSAVGKRPIEHVIATSEQTNTARQVVL